MSEYYQVPQKRKGFVLDDYMIISNELIQYSAISTSRKTIFKMSCCQDILIPTLFYCIIFHLCLHFISYSCSIQIIFTMQSVRTAANTPPMPMRPLKIQTQQIYDERFLHVNIVGCGAYGQVYRVKHRQTGKVYAIKKYANIFKNRVLALRTLRELTILRRMKHPKIIKIFDILPPPNLADYNQLYVVLEYLPFDLRKLCSKNKILNDQQIVKILYQLLIVLKYLSSVKILHRDLKPQNILSDDDYNIKLCDFGLARSGLKQPSFSELKSAKQGPMMTSHVVSRWYRAPQIILMQTKYDAGIEMWSVGCIMGELIAEHEKNKKINVTHPRRALFEGKACFPLSPPKGNKDITYRIENGFPQSEDDQISKILQVIGSPSAEEISFIEEEVALNYLKSLPKYEKKRASQIFDYCLPEWEDFLQKSLVFDPRKRMTIDEAIQHRIFDGIRNMADFDFPQGDEFDICLPSEMPIEQIKARMDQEINYYRTDMDIENEYQPMPNQ